MLLAKMESQKTAYVTGLWIEVHVVHQELQD